MIVSFYIFILSQILLNNFTSGKLYKEIFKVRSGKYISFYNVDYKFINLPQNLIELNVFFKFVRWIGFVPLCPTSFNITSVFQYGNFPMFKQDKKFQYNFNQRNKITMFVSTAEKKIMAKSFQFKSPKPGIWLFGTIYDDNDEYQHPVHCLADLQVTLTGFSMKPQISFILPTDVESIKIPIIVEKSQGKLIEINCQVPLTRIRISHLCKGCILSVSVNNKVIPNIFPEHGVRIGAQTYSFNETIFSSEFVQMSTKTFLYIRSWEHAIYKFYLLVQYITVTRNTKQLAMLPALMKIRGDTLFVYRFTTADSDSSRIPLMITPGKPLIVPFFIEPIKDQGSILSVDLSLTSMQGNYSIHICISEFGLSNPDDILNQTGISIICRQPISRLINKSTKIQFKYYYPEWDWWYITILVQPSNVSYRDNSSLKANISVTSKSCAHDLSSCSGKGYCLLTAVDTGLVSSCHCFKPYFGLDCQEIHIPSIQKSWNSMRRRNSLVFSNIAFLPAVAIASMQKLYVLVFIYLTTAGFSMVYHMCYMEDTDLAYCALKVEDLAYYDHLAAVISIWITMMSLSTLSYKTQMLLNIIMIFVCAILADVIQKSIWFYAIPILVGLAIIIICWVYRMYQLKCIFPPLDWWVFGLIPGLVIAGIGFIMFRLSIKQEYAYYFYHSLWHIFIALSICFMLPNTKRWTKALKQSTAERAHFSLLSNLITFNSEKWYKFKKDFNYYVHLDVLINPLLERNSRWSICKSY